LFTLLALAEALATWRADLVEKRRRLRIFVVGVAGAYALVNTLAQLVLSAAPAPAALTLLNSLCLLIVMLLVAWPLLRLGAAELFVDEPVPLPVPTEPDEPPPADETTEPADPAGVAALERLMHEQHAYREEGLTIGGLAARLSMPEYKLRRLINQGLGYRNFNAFLNHYRLADVKAALLDPAQAATPVLEIAMDAGFQSLGPFNRAFKTETGLTPTEYRRLRGRLPQEKVPSAPADFEIG
jgi:AraC-like DNA-binding protein